MGSSETSEQPLFFVQSTGQADASAVPAMLAEEQAVALVDARRAVNRMLANPAQRDPEGQVQLQRLFAVARVRATVIELQALREVIVEAERRIYNLRRGLERPCMALAEALEATIYAIELGLDGRARSTRRGDLEERCVRTMRLLAEANATATSESSAEDLSDLELFAEDAQQQLHVCREALIRAAEQPEDPADDLNAAFRAMHTIKGNAGMLGIANVEMVARASEDCLDGLRARQLALTNELMVALLNVLDKLERDMGKPDFGWARESEQLDHARAMAANVAKRTRLGELLVERRFVHQSQLDLVLAVKKAPLGEALVLLQALDDEQLVEALEIQRRLRLGDEVPDLPAAGPKTGARKERVTAEALAELRHMVRELCTRHDEAAPLGPDLERLSTTVERLGRSTLEPLLSRMQQTAAELAERQGKKLDVRIHGGDLWLDATLLGVLADALIHLVRNAVDHGIETPDERTAAGKPELATLALLATRKQGVLRIQLEDTGRGIDPARVRERALERGMLSEEEAEALDDAQSRELLFAPGFTTRDEVTDISGRGVGLDAVKHAVESAGGRVAVTSSLGAGTCFTLRFEDEVRTSESAITVRNEEGAQTQ